MPAMGPRAHVAAAAAAAEKPAVGGMLIRKGNTQHALVGAAL